MTQRPRAGALGILLVAGTLLLGACSGGASNDASNDASKTSTTTLTTTSTTMAESASDSTAICAVFERLVANGAGPGAQFQESTPEGWERRIETTGEIVDAAPPEWRNEAETYLQMVKDRAQLAADNGYVGVDDLPADVREAFIVSHRAMQQQVNALIRYMSSECRTRSAS